MTAGQRGMEASLIYDRPAFLVVSGGQTNVIVRFDLSTSPLDPFVMVGPSGSECVTVGWQQTKTKQLPDLFRWSACKVPKPNHVAHSCSPPVHRSHSPQNRDSFSPRTVLPPCICICIDFLFQSAGSGEGLAPLVNFYSKLPKGRAPAAAFDPEKKALNRLGLAILFFFGVGYTLDYNSMGLSLCMLGIIADKTPPLSSAPE